MTGVMKNSTAKVKYFASTESLYYIYFIEIPFVNNNSNICIHSFNLDCASELPLGLM